MLETETITFLTRLTGRAPADETLWRKALTHGSTGAEHDYQRLEFLGDRVLGLVIAEWLHEAGDENEGKLSQRLNALVSGTTCARIARENGVGAHMLLGKQARDDGGHDSDKILGDVMESLIGAAFVEQGYEGARAVVRQLWADEVAGRTGMAKHPKSALQEWAAGNRRRMPEYRLVERAGPDHASRFTVAVSIKGIGEVEATASSKSEAESLAAANFMARFG